MRKLHFKYYMFDWDDNILHMPTRIHLERKTTRGWVAHAVSTAEFARIRRDTVNYRPRRGDWDSAFEDFYDTGRHGLDTFLRDTRRALRPIIDGRQRGAPSFLKFKKALIEGRLFAIISARSHSQRAMRKGVEYFIARVLTAAEREAMLRNLRRFVAYFGDDPARYSDRAVLKNYLDLNHYRGVNSPEFRRIMGLRSRSGSESPEDGKKVAIKDFVDHLMRQMRQRRGDEPISIGFSDDDVHNLRAIRDFISKELSREHPDVKFVVYDTSVRGRAGGRKTVIRGRPGTGSSEPAKRGVVDKVNVRT